MNTDVVIVGAGPSGIFTALKLIEERPQTRIVMLEKGLPVERRHCPKDKTGHCMNCNPCNITTGFSGAGAFSDGKLSLSHEVGGDLPELIGATRAQDTIDIVDKIYLRFGADSHVEGAGGNPAARAIRLRAIQAGLKLVDCPIRHLGTEKAQELYAAIEKYLLDAGVDMRFRTECRDIVIENDACTGVVAVGPAGEERIDARSVIVATGRRGADWLEGLCTAHHIKHGHSFKERKSDNTNLAILCSHNFREPFNQPIAFAQNVGRLCNMLGDGHILVQRFGDILDGKRTWEKELARSNVRPTLPDAVAGDITSALPYRTMTSIVAFMLAVDKAIPGFASAETLLYAPELKFYSNRVSMDAEFNTNVAGLHCLGDSSGWTRGLMMASVMGYLMGERLAAEL